MRVSRMGAPIRDGCPVREIAYCSGWLVNSETIAGAGLEPSETACPRAASPNARRTSPPPCTGLPPVWWITRGRLGPRQMRRVSERRVDGDDPLPDRRLLVGASAGATGPGRCSGFTHEKPKVEKDKRLQSRTSLPVLNSVKVDAQSGIPLSTYLLIL